MHVFFKQVRILTSSNLKSRYRKTIAGFLWVILNPLIIYIVQSQVFRHILKIDIPNYYLFLLSGLLPWLFIQQTAEMCTPILQNSGPLLKSFPAHPLVYISAQLLDNIINFIAAFFVILLPVSFFEPLQTVGLLGLPFAILSLVFAVFGMGSLLSILQVFYRDTRYIVTFLFSVAYFLTPIFYPIALVPEKWRGLIELNPFYLLISPFRISLYQFDLEVFVIALGKSVLVAAIFVALSLILWRKKRNAVYFNV